jgi:hypothetical protein
MTFSPTFLVNVSFLYLSDIPDVWTIITIKGSASGVGAYSHRSLFPRAVLRDVNCVCERTPFRPGYSR